MKKFLSLVLVVIMLYSFGCWAFADNEPIKVGFIYLHDEQSTYDLNFLNAAKEACEKLGVEYVNRVGIPEGQECFETALDLADEGCDIVFADSFGHEDYMIQAALEYPEVDFCHATGTKAHTYKLPNYHNAFASIYEGRFLAGIAAGMKLNDLITANSTLAPIVGYVGAYPYAEVISGYSAFFLGVRSVCPDAKMKVIFTGSWYDEALEKEAAISLIQNGCIVLSAHADSMGMPTACENLGVPFVAYNGSFMNACPNTYIISTKINWEPYFEYIISQKMNGEPIDVDWIGTIETNSVLLTELNYAVASLGTEGVLNDAIEAFKSGDLRVFDIDTFTVDGKRLESYIADVDSDAEYKGDTEVIIDGCFSESTFRSAPYFDVPIDGITVLGS